MLPPLAYTPIPNLVGRRGRRVGVGVMVGVGSGVETAVLVHDGVGVLFGAAARDELPMRGK